MRIAILVDELAPGSAPKLIGWPIRKLKELGIKAEALVIIDKGYWQNHKAHYDFHLANVKINYLFPKFPKLTQKLNFKLPGMSFFSLHHIVSWFFSHKAVNRKEFDIIVAHCQYSGLAARNIKKHCNIPFLLLLWDPSTFTAEKIYKQRFGWKYPFLYFAAKLLDKFALKDCSGVITSGTFHHQHLKNITDKNLEILAPGCFVKDNFPDFFLRKKIILTYDRWDIGNIPNIFLDILKSLSDKEIKLVIGGFWHPKILKDDFYQKVKAMNLEDRVELLGPLDENMIMDLCSQAMLHLHPVHEAFGMQSLEAAACGCPIIIPQGSGVCELFQHGVHGYFPKPGDFKEMIYYVEKIFQDKDKTYQISKNAWDKAKEYTWDNYAKNLYNICSKYVAAGLAPAEVAAGQTRVDIATQQAELKNGGDK